MKKYAEYISFLNTGCLGILKIGASNNDVEKAIGKPEDNAYSKDPNSLYSYYDKVLQIGFNKGRISWYGIYFSHVKEDTDEILVLECLFPITKKTTSKEFKYFLEQEEIEFEVNKQLSSDETVCYNIGHNIIAFFYNDIIDKFQVTTFR